MTDPVDAKRLIGYLPEELRLYALLVVGSGLTIAIVLWFWGGSNGAAEGAEAGLPDYRIANLARDAELMPGVQSAAEIISRTFLSRAS